MRMFAGVLFLVLILPAEFIRADKQSSLERTRMLARGICGACHSYVLVQQQRLNRKGWESIVEKMQKEHGLVLPPGKVKDELLNYLSRIFSPGSPEFYMDGMPLRNPNPLPETIP